MTESGSIVLLTLTGDTDCIFVIELSAYPWCKKPQVCDKIALIALIGVEDPDTKSLKTVYPLNGIYEVDTVFAGNGEELVPDFVTKNDLELSGISGYRLQIRKIDKLEPGTVPVNAKVLYCRWVKRQ